MVIEVPLSKNGKKYKGLHIAIVDDIDADLIEFNWSCAGVSAHYGAYVCRYPIIEGKQFYLYMHRVIMERMQDGKPLEKGQFVDHINGNGLDNRRENLRLSTHAQNMRNRKKSTNNKSGYKGVSLDQSTQKWKSQIRYNGKKLYLGLFDTKEEAYKAYCKAANELHQDFANHG